MSYQFLYIYGVDAWHLAYLPGVDAEVAGYPDAEYDLPGVVPAGDWIAYATMYGASDGAAAGLVIKMADDSRVSMLGAWNWPLGYSEPGGENTYITTGTGEVFLKVEYHSEAGELHLSSALTRGVWQLVAVVPVTTPVDTGILLRYATEGVAADGHLAAVALVPGLEPLDTTTEIEVPYAQAPTLVAAPRIPDPVPGITLDVEPTVYALIGAPYGDQEYDIGKSARWLEYFSDKLFALDVNTGDQRYWIVNWTITFPDAEHAITNINYFANPIGFRKEQWRLADKQYHMDDDSWLLWIDGTEGLSFDNSNLPDDYAFLQFMTFIYREIARAEDFSQDSVVLPLFIFLRSAEVQNVTYQHLANDDTGVIPPVMQAISVPYYLPYQGLTRLMKASVLRDPSFDWTLLDRPVPVLLGPSGTAQAAWHWRAAPIVESAVSSGGEMGVDGSSINTSSYLVVSSIDNTGKDQSAFLHALSAGDGIVVVHTGNVVFTVDGPAVHFDSPTLWWIPYTYVSGTEPLDGTTVQMTMTLQATPPPVKAQIVSYAYAHWQMFDIPPGQTEVPPLSESNDEGFKMRKRISQVRPVASLPTWTWDPAADPAGVPGPWAVHTLTNINPDFIPITDSPVTAPDTTAAGVKTPLYDTVIRLNMRDGVWYEGDVSGNTPMTWDSVNEKWTTPYDPNIWPSTKANGGVNAPSNPDFVAPPTPVGP